MNELKKLYPIVLIPEGTCFSRKAFDTQIYETMFFSYDTYVVGAINHREKPTQVWITKKPIISTYIIKNKTKNNFYITDLEYCYEKFCGEKMDYLKLKHKDNPRRGDFLNFLKQNRIDSWVTSAENKVDFEFHLFTEKNEKLMGFKEYLNKENEVEYNKINSFKNLVFNP